MGRVRAEREDSAVRRLGHAAASWDTRSGVKERPTVVAEILSDGTVQVLDRAAVDEGVTPWGSGVIGGLGWTLWWERRRWT